MSKKQYLTNKKGSLLFPKYGKSLRAYHANPCGCDEDFDNRPEIFVDKHAIDGGNGETLETAYNDLNKTISCHPNTKISIKGYGIDDKYNAVENESCIFLNGLDNDVYFDYVLNCNNCRFDNININIINVNGAFRFCNNSTFNNCNANNNTIGYWHSFYVCQYSTFNNCKSNDNIHGIAFYACNNSTFNNCEAINNKNGRAFYECNDAIFNNCKAINIDSEGFSSCDNSTFNSCTSNSNSGGGFRTNFSTYENCTANNNKSAGFKRCDNCTFEKCTANDNGHYDTDDDNHWYACGFYDNVDALYLDCSASGNHHNPDWTCDGTDDSHCDECKGGF